MFSNESVFRQITVSNDSSNIIPFRLFYHPNTFLLLADSLSTITSTPKLVEYSHRLNQAYRTMISYLLPHRISQLKHLPPISHPHQIIKFCISP